MGVSQNNADTEYMVSHSSSCIGTKQNNLLFKLENHYITVLLYYNTTFTGFSKMVSYRHKTVRVSISSWSTK